MKPKIARKIFFVGVWTEVIVGFIAIVLMFDNKSSIRNIGIILCVVTLILFVLLGLFLAYLSKSKRYQKTLEDEKKEEREKIEEEIKNEREKRISPIIDQIENGTYPFPRMFYEYCRSEHVNSLDSDFNKEKAQLLFNQFKKIHFYQIEIPESIYNSAYSDLDTVFNEGRAAMEVYEKTAQKGELPIDQKQLLEEQIKYYSLRGREKRRAMLNSNISLLSEKILDILNAQKAMNTLAVAMSTSAYTQKKNDWAFLGGVASGIGGAGAGIAVASNTMIENERIEAQNQANRAAVKKTAQMIAREGMNLDGDISDLKKARDLYTSELQKLDQKVLLHQKDSNTLYKGLELYGKVKKINKTVKGVLSNPDKHYEYLKFEITIRSNNDADVPEGTHIVTDGFINVKIYSEDTLIGTTPINLPMMGIEKGEKETIEGVWNFFLPGNHEYKLEYENIVLWQMEA